MSIASSIVYRLHVEKQACVFFSFLMISSGLRLAKIFKTVLRRYFKLYPMISAFSPHLENPEYLCNISVVNLSVYYTNLTRVL